MLSRLNKRACCLPCQLIVRPGMINGWERRYAPDHVTRDLLSLSTASGRQLQASARCNGGTHFGNTLKLSRVDSTSPNPGSGSTNPPVVSLLLRAAQIIASVYAARSESRLIPIFKRV